MLTTRRSAGTELRPHHQRQTHCAARHEPKFCRLIHQLIQAHPEEVEVHQFHDGPTARHRGADGKTHDCRFGDRRIEHSTRILCGQSPGQTENISAGNVDAGKKHIRIGRQRVVERRLEDLGLRHGRAARADTHVEAVRR